MRVVFVGAGNLSVRTARSLIAHGHEVVIVEADPARIESLTDALDCGFLCGDGSRPAILREADPSATDVLLCLTGNDQTNIIASLVGRSLGFPRIVTRITDEEFEHICLELGLEHAVIPDRTIGRYLAEVVEGHDILEISAAVREPARIFVFVARETEAGPISGLGLPERSRVTHLYRGGELVLADPDCEIHTDDEVVVLAHRDELATLQERWAHPDAEGES